MFRGNSDMSAAEGRAQGQGRRPRRAARRAAPSATTRARPTAPARPRTATTSAGEWVPAASGTTFENRNPADRDDLIGTFADSGPEDVEQAVAAAREAFPRWRAVPAPKRGRDPLPRGRDPGAPQGGVLARHDARDGQGPGRDARRRPGSDRHDVLHGRRGPPPVRPDDAVRAAEQVPDVGAHAGRASPGLITPWNFPMAIPSWKMMPALILGNTVVIKPATDTPLSVVNLIQALEEAGLPPGVVNMVTGGGTEVGAPLMSHNDVGIVSFTGSTDVGRKVSEACAPAFKHCHLEMGGKNIIMVMDDARPRPRGGRRGLGRVRHHRPALHRGQPRGRAQEGLPRVHRPLRRRARRRCKVGNGLARRRREMGPCVNESAARRRSRSTSRSRKDEGAKLLTGGHRLDRRRPRAAASSTSPRSSATAIPEDARSRARRSSAPSSP